MGSEMCIRDGFGSRVDIYFKNKKVLAKLGQNVVAGESLLASE